MTKSRLWLLLPALFALAWFWPVLQHGFRSDDFLTVYYLDRDAESVRWGRVWEEWARPWFGVRDLYRPFVSLTLGCNWALSTSPFGFHLLNLMLLMGTATLVALTARRLARGRATVAAVVAGFVVVLHPAAVEPAAWIAARTTGLQVFWCAMAYWSFVRWRDGDSGVWLPCLATVLACASKEGAVMLPASLLLIDLLRGGRPHWRRHLPFFAIVGGYLVFRRVLLGWFTTAEAGHTLGERLANAGELLMQLVRLPSADGGHFGSIVPVALMCLVTSGRQMWCLIWAGVLLLPGTTHVVLHDNELAGRFVFDAVPAVALFAALGLDRRLGEQWNRLRVGVGMVAFTATVGIASYGWLARYDDDNATIVAAQRELVSQAAAAEAGRPFGVAGLPGLPLLQPPLWGFLTQRPFAERDLPVVGLWNILNEDPAAAAVFTDTTAIHALVADGAGSAIWDGDSRTLKPVAKAAPGVVEFFRNEIDPKQFRPMSVLPPTAVATIEIFLPDPVKEVRIEILGNLDGEYAASPCRMSTSGDGEQVWWLDTAGVLPWMVAASFGGGPAGIELTCDGAEPAAGTRVRAHAEVPVLDTPEVAAGPIDRAELAEAMDLRSPWSLHRVVYLLLPTGLFATVPEAGEPLTIDPRIASQIQFVCDILGPCRVHWFWVEDQGPFLPPRRSALRTCIVR